MPVESQHQGGIDVAEQLGRRVHAEAGGEPEGRTGVPEVVHPKAGAFYQQRKAR